MRIAASDVAVVVAHPDDETIGCGALLSHLDRAVIVTVTDGAPRDLSDARACGFADAESYAAARLGELHQALAVAGCRPKAVLPLGIPDQQAARQLVPLSRLLADILRRQEVRAVLTHAYEGGHPDHDASAFAVHAAARQLAAEGRHLTLLEMPLYRLGPEGMLPQDFVAPRDDVVAVKLTDDEQATKRGMIAAHASQRATLASFQTALEFFRPAPDYDFTELPNEGRLFYEQFDWGLTGREWQALARQAMRELAQGVPP